MNVLHNGTFYCDPYDRLVLMRSIMICTWIDPSHTGTFHLNTKVSYNEALNASKGYDYVSYSYMQQSHMNTPTDSYGYAFIDSH